MGYLAGHNFLKKEDLTTRDDGSHEVEYACTKCGQTIYFIDKCADEKLGNDSRIKRQRPMKEKLKASYCPKDGAPGLVEFDFSRRTWNLKCLVCGDWLKNEVPQ